MERLGAGGTLTADDRVLLEAYAAEGREGADDRLYCDIRQTVERLTRGTDLGSPRVAARALLGETDYDADR